MRSSLLPAALLALIPFSALAYVEAPHTLGLVVRDSSNIVLVEVSRVNKEKGLIIFKKLKDIKGQEPQTEIKHNIGQRGFHPREWQNVMSWAAEGKKAVFFHNGGASETCIGTYWYQCYREGEWWGMSHAEPFLLRTYCGDPEKLATAVGQMLQGQDVIVPCFADGSKEQLHQRKGKLQRVKASLKRIDWNPKRDFVAWGGDGDEIEEFKTIVLLAESAPDWKFLPSGHASSAGDRWRLPDFDDSRWRSGKAPIGYGEEEIRKRGGVWVQEQGQPFYFRRAFNIPADVLSQKGVTFKIAVASDDSASVFLNGAHLADDPEADHEFSYWNHEIDVPADRLKPGANLVAVVVRNKQGSSDLYLDMEISAQAPLPKPPKRPETVAANNPGASGAKPPRASLNPEPPPPAAKIQVDRTMRTVIVPCAIAPRKLPNLQEIYPIEVIASYPAPAGQKAHETVVAFTGIRPSEVHKALEELGLKPGKPAKGDGKAEGPELKIFLEIPGKKDRVPIETVLVDRKTSRPMSACTWHFTGSNFRQPDPERDDRVYGADLTGTLIALFPVTDDTVIQSSFTMKEEAMLKLETSKIALPPEGTAVRLVIVAK